MAMREYIVRLACSWFILSIGFVIAFAGFVLGAELIWMVGTLQCMLGSGFLAYTEMRRLNDRLGH